MTGLVVVLVTAGSEDEAARIARTLVEERLAACCTILAGCRSLYIWEGKTCDQAEALLLIKTPRGLLEQLVDRVKALHSYTVPEVIALPILGGSSDYLTWVKAQTE